ncbi:MAG TPA: ATP-binding cassette domain-containing protein [Burkholderiales bacterium]
MREDAPPAAPAVRVRALVKRYRKRVALDGIDLTIARGEAFGLVGANGAGKTTLLRCLLDLASPDAGTVEIFGSPAGDPAARRRLAYLPERFVPPYYLRGEEFLRAMLALMRERYRPEAAAALCAELELEPAALARPVRALSKGMTQKLGLAACFLARRELYVLDEPMSGLDPAARVAVKSVLQRLAGEGRTLLFTSHVLADVEELCSSIAVLHRARLRFHGAPRALCASTGEAGLERAFMKCIREEPADPRRAARA